ncbi:hypothetical protein ASPCAL07152 [Aspergillus calidoustus]|uniref:Zn(2)-C6 fungal-type domain-containing protein n=1 Tax=Aspergillus calidoustus TaxID=454130 RepID=A0A0U5CA99_ASPCI|nr:hypothetical protein ASPCAL07152 [Aspergillus calidoustus]
MGSSKVPAARRTRSKTGCRTCRARHLKCDETPVACRNCSSTGRRCDGYDAQRLPPKLKAALKQPENQYLSPSSLGTGLDWAMTSDERRCLSYFQFHTVPTLLEFFDSALWQKLVLEMSRSEPPVYHAIVALSAIHQNSEENGMPLATPAPSAVNPWHQFAEDQLARSIKLINQRRTSQDPRLREVILVCCLLFVLADLLRGFYENAFLHLQSGLRILRDLQLTGPVANPTSRQSLVEQCIVAAFAHLDILAAHYDRVFPILRAHGQHIAHPPAAPTPFHTLPEARIAFDSLLSAAYEFSAPCMGMTEEQVVASYSVLQAQQHEVWWQMNQFTHSFRPFYTTTYHKLSPKEQRGADIINLNLISLPVCLQTCLLGKNYAAMAHYTSELETVCRLTEEIMSKFPERPSFTLEAGVLPPLYLSAILCVEYGVRWRAIELLRSWPHREGPFDSNWLASLAEEALRLDLHERCTAEPGFAEMSFVVNGVGGQVTASAMLQKLTRIRRQKIDMMLRTKRLESATLDDQWDPLNAVGPVKGMASWSCIRAFRARMSIPHA